jgi:hypothetical protein
VALMLEITSLYLSLILVAAVAFRECSSDDFLHSCLCSD